MVKYTLAIIELYNCKYHGYNDKLNNRFLLNYKIKLDEFYNYDYLNIIENMKDFYYDNIDNSLLNHNSKYIEKYFNPQLVIYKKLKTHETICINKTYCISIIQRLWKKKYYNRLRLAKIRSNPRHIYYRKATGRWLI
jgi:hypothetical protein